MSDFSRFAIQIKQRFDLLSQHELYVTVPDGNQVWEKYLAAFPEGTNPIFRERTEHDCSCCRQFIKNLANVVALVDGKLLTLWDNPETFEYPYDVVATALREFTRGHPISGLFRAELPQYGAVSNIERLEDGSTREWKHLHGNVLRRHQAVSDSAAQQGQYATSVAMFKRALGMPNEAGEAQQGIRIDAITTVLDLIDSNSLYRGAEFRASVQQFFDLGKQMAFLKPGQETDAFVWATSSNPVVRIRNTSIGTLLTDLSEGVDLQTAVASFEKKVAPENYKRPTALITPAMIESALKTVDELGLRAALERRFAKISDVSVNNVLWVDNGVQGQMKDGLAGLLMEAVSPAPVDVKDAIGIDISGFMADVLPRAKTIQVLVKNAHQNNLVSLTAPVHADAGDLFKWDNPFAWSYNGNITDSSIRKAVQGRGGRVDGAFRFSHSWNYDKRNCSLMDLHVFMPGSTITTGTPPNNIYGSSQRVGWNNRKHTASGGVQDVDYVEAAPEGYVPVENITFPDVTRMPEGDYICKIHNWALRQPTKGGFKAEIEFAGQVFEYEYDKPLGNKEWVDVATVTLKDGVFTIKHHLPCSTSSHGVWGINTEQFVRVTTLMFSPNFWDGQEIGNKHWFFLLEGCKNPEPARGIYNEFLTPELEKHRKVFEVLGDKTKCQPTDDQLSGVGFSSTRGDEVVVQVTGEKLRKTYKIQF